MPHYPAWHEWLCHSNFSFLTGASHPHELLARALACGYASLAITDFDGVYGLARSHLAWQRLRRSQLPAAAELRLIHGMELHLSTAHDRPLLWQDTLALIAPTRTAYAQLCALGSLAHQGGKHLAHLPLPALLDAAHGELIAIQPMRGLLRRAQGHSQLRQRLLLLREAFPSRLYLAVSRHLHPGEDAWIAPTLSLAAELDLPCLLSQDAFFHVPEQKPLSDVLHAIRNNRTLDDCAAQLFPNAERCLQPSAVLTARYSDLPIYAQACRAAHELHLRCEFDMSCLRYQYPKEMIPAGHSAQSFLEQLSWQAATKRYGSPLPERIASLLHKELELIRELAFADYFLTVWDIVCWARSQGILCQGRGSAANSAVCFVLGITSVDPALFDLLFERFVNAERGDPPDIDVDFEHERREEVIQYIYQRYGRARAAMVANVITFRRRGALRAVGLALGVPEVYLKSAAQHLDSRRYRQAESAVTLADVQAQTRAQTRATHATREPPKQTADPRPQEPRTEADRPEPALDDASIPWDLWAELAERLWGFPRHLGIHSGGFILSDQPLDHLVSQEPATMPGRSVVQWCKEDIEGLGFFKVDILALGMLSALRKCLHSLAQHEGISLDLARIPANDAATYAMIQAADTIGTFQIESRAQMSMLPRLRPACFYDLVIEVAIIRPGPIQGGMIHPYLRRRHGLEPVRYADPRLRAILARTLGVPLFQEQVMRIAMVLGDFSPAEANELRRHMGAWSIKGDLSPWINKLAAGMRHNGIAEEFIQPLLAQMRGFADYGFPESHAASFALLAYASAYLKCHHPAAFFAAVLNSQPMGFYSVHSLLQAARHAAVPLRAICVQRSHWDTTLEPTGQQHSPWALRLGLRLVRGLRRAGADLLLASRERLPEGFTDLESFLTQTALPRSDLTALAAAQALRIFGVERKAALWLAEAAPFLDTLEDPQEPLSWEDESPWESAERDFAATSTTLGPHPASIIRRQHWCYDPAPEQLTAATALDRLAAGRRATIFGMVLVRQAPPAAKGMVFMTLEDEHGFYNLVFTPDLYAAYAALVDRQSFLCVTGQVQRQGGAHSLRVLQVHPPRLQRAEVIPMHRTTSSHTEDAVAAALTATSLSRCRQYQ